MAVGCWPAGVLGCGCHTPAIQHCTQLPQIDVLVDGYTEDGELYGRTQWDAPDIDHIVFLLAAEEAEGLPALEVGQLRRCRVLGNSTFDLEATPVA